MYSEGFSPSYIKFCVFYFQADAIFSELHADVIKVITEDSKEDVASLSPDDQVHTIEDIWPIAQQMVNEQAPPIESWISAQEDLTPTAIAPSPDVTSTIAWSDDQGAQEAQSDNEQMAIRVEYTTEDIPIAKTPAVTRCITDTVTNSGEGSGAVVERSSSPDYQAVSLLLNFKEQDRNVSLGYESSAGLVRALPKLTKSETLPIYKPTEVLETIIQDVTTVTTVSDGDELPQLRRVVSDPTPLKEEIEAPEVSVEDEVVNEMPPPPAPDQPLMPVLEVPAPPSPPEVPLPPDIQPTPADKVKVAHRQEQELHMESILALEPICGPEVEISLLADSQMSSLSMVGEMQPTMSDAELRRGERGKAASHRRVNG